MLLDKRLKQENGLTLNDSAEDLLMDLINNKNKSDAN